MREYLHYDWHWEWLYGNGDLGNMGIHYIDGCRMAVGHDKLPPRAISIGGRFGYVDDGETPNTQIAFLDYAPAPIIFEVRGLPKDKSFLGGNWERNAKQTMDFYTGIQIGLVIHCEGGYAANNKAFDKDGKTIKEFAPTNEDLNANFIKAVRSRKASDLQGDVLQGHLSAALIHMANISYRLGKTKSPGEIKERIQGHKELVAAHERLAEHLSASSATKPTNSSRATIESRSSCRKTCEALHLAQNRRDAKVFFLTASRFCVRPEANDRNNERR
jgi:hypothetical protein